MGWDGEGDGEGREVRREDLLMVGVGVDRI